jgi:membrane-associated protease RseP (regulator of RpoE activity)
MRKRNKRYLLQAGLFLATIITTTLAGVEWMGLGELTWKTFAKGFLFSVPFLGILTVHEFGHYITARLYKAKVTLPYYIPLFIPGLQSIGTMGAFIRIKSPLKSRQEIFDIGVAGPLAGFVVALFILFYGFTNLPEPQHIYSIHESYEEFGLNYDKHVYNYEFARKSDSINFEKNKLSDSWMTNGLESIGLLPSNWREIPFKPEKEYAELSIGKNLLFLFFENYIVSDKSLIPNKYEMFHYPFLFAGYLALFFTALNLLPIGQLDGGHILYGLFGTAKHKIISSSVFILFVFFAGLGIFKDNLVGNVFKSTEDLVVFAPLYLYFLYFIFSRVTEKSLNNLMIASCVFSAQFFCEFFSWDIIGFNGWFLFAVLIGRFLGVHHPPAYIDEPLDVKRKIIGWVSLVIFIICFTPNLFNLETFRP